MVIQTWISNGKLIAQFIQQLASWCYNWLAANKCLRYWLNIWLDTIQTEATGDAEMLCSIIQALLLIMLVWTAIPWSSVVKGAGKTPVTDLWRAVLSFPLFIGSDHTWGPLWDRCLMYLKGFWHSFWHDCLSLWVPIKCGLSFHIRQDSSRDEFCYLNPFTFRSSLYERESILWILKIHVLCFFFLYFTPFVLRQKQKHLQNQTYQLSVVNGLYVNGLTWSGF